MTTILFFLLIFFAIWSIDRGIRPPLMLIAEQKKTEFATRTINSAVKSTENMTFDDMVDISIDNNGNVSVLGWNMASVNEALRMATDRAEYFLYGRSEEHT